MQVLRAAGRAQRSAMTGGAIVAVAGLLAALALVYTNATGVTDTARDAQLQQQSESALGAAASARNAIGQALLLSGATDDTTLVSASVVEARAILQALDERVRTVIAGTDDSNALDASLADALTSAALVLDAIEDGDIETAGTTVAGDLATAFTALSNDLASLRDDLVISIKSAAAQAGTVATASRFMVAFVIPLLAVGIAFSIARRERKRERLAAELEHERAVNKSKDQLIANLSHELRTPLTGIFTSALAIDDAGFADIELARELNNVIIDQSADLTRMVEDLLVSAQADAGRLHFELKMTDIVGLVASLTREFSRFDVSIEVALEPANVNVDPSRTRQLLRNLVSNAAKYGNGHISIGGKTQGSKYLVQVVDDGPGVSPEVEDRMFERFVHRGDQPLIMGSVGLGLAISKVLAEGMGGQVTYRRIGERTAFEVTLDRIANESMPPDPAPYQEPAVLSDEQNPATSLDEVGISPGIRRALRRHGVVTLDQIDGLSAEDLLTIDGIGSARAKSVIHALAAHKNST